MDKWDRADLFAELERLVKIDASKSPREEPAPESREQELKE
jgi:hypothetical protein